MMTFKMHSVGFFRKGFKIVGSCSGREWGKWITETKIHPFFFLKLSFGAFFLLLYVKFYVNFYAKYGFSLLSLHKNTHLGDNWGSSSIRYSSFKAEDTCFLFLPNKRRPLVILSCLSLPTTSLYHLFHPMVLKNNRLIFLCR